MQMPRSRSAGPSSAVVIQRETGIGACQAGAEVAGGLVSGMIGRFRVMPIAGLPVFLGGAAAAAIWHQAQLVDRREWVLAPLGPGCSGMSTRAFWRC